MTKEENVYEVRQRIIEAEPLIYNKKTEESIQIAEGIAIILNKLEDIEKQIK